MKPNILYLSDLDGTLLDPQACLPQRDAARINRLLADGVKITFATARTVRSVAAILGEIDFTLPGAQPVALMNGVLIRDMRRGVYTHVEEIPRETAEAVLAGLGKIAAIEPFVYAIDPSHPIDGDPMVTYYRRIANSAMRAFRDERVTRYQKPFLPMESLGDVPGRIVYFAVVGAEKDVRNAAEQVAHLPGIAQTAYRDAYSDAWYLEIFSETASKKHALEVLRETAQADFTVAFGDNRNDLPMFEAADLAVAVTRAVPEVREQADRTTENVVDFVEQYETEFEGGFGKRS